jgi:putative PIN family toxin of toxin-antitoxin system
MKFVIDTNVVLSALYSNKGASHLLLRWLFQQPQRLNIVSTPLVIEFEDVLTRPEHMQRYPLLSKQDIGFFIDDICAVSWHQKIYYLWRPYLPDPKDDMVLETAFNGQADYIITHNIRDFRGVAESFAIQPITPGDFWRLQQEK